jgi:hypothetical protein
MEEQYILNLSNCRMQSLIMSILKIIQQIKEDQFIYLNKVHKLLI